MTTYKLGGDEWKGHLETARGFVSRYEREAASKNPDNFLMKHNLSLATTYYRLVLLYEVDNPEEIMKAKEGIVTKLRELTNGSKQDERQR